MAEAPFVDGWKQTPYWWEEAPRPAASEIHLPDRVDVAVVGSGYAGMAAALHLARAGRDVLIFEAGDPGHGASSRSGGMAGGGLKLGYSELKTKYGQAKAADLVREGDSAMRFF